MIYLDFSFLTLTPQHILLYAGENDLQRGISVERAKSNMQALISRIEAQYPATTIHILGVKYSPKRKAQWKKFAAFNAYFQAFSLTNTSFYFYHHPALQSPTTDDSLFTADGIHLTEKGVQSFVEGVLQVCKHQ